MADTSLGHRKKEKKSFENLRLEIERESSILVIVELTVGSLAGWADAVEAQFSRPGLTGVNETADVAAKRAKPKAITGADNL